MPEKCARSGSTFRLMPWKLTQRRTRMPIAAILSSASAPFSGIVPCGVRGPGVPSLVDLGLPVSMAEVDMALRGAFEPIFGPTTSEAED